MDVNKAQDITNIEHPLSLREAEIKSITKIFDGTSSVEWMSPLNFFRIHCQNGCEIWLSETSFWIDGVFQYEFGTDPVQFYLSTWVIGVSTVGLSDAQSSLCIHYGVDLPE